MCMRARKNQQQVPIDQHIAIWNDIDVDEDGSEIGVHHVKKK